MRPFTSRIVAAIGLLAFPLAPVSAKDHRIDTAARSAMTTTGAQGLAIAIIEQGKVSHVAAFGHRDAQGRPLAVDTVMYGASLTKAVFGYLTAQLVQEGRLELDKPIAALLAQPIPTYGNVAGYGQWSNLGTDPRWRSITPRMTLTHSTGFANFALEPDRRLRIHFTPGTRYAYSGEGLMLLQFGLERGQGLDIEAECAGLASLRPFRFGELGQGDETTPLRLAC